MKTQDLAYVLHRRPFKDTSLLVDFFTQNHGIITAVCRGARQNKKKPPLESFIPFWIEYDHRHSLASLYQYEIELNQEYQPIHFLGSQLYCGLYINELLIKLLGRHHDPYLVLFSVYQETLNSLCHTEMLEAALRKFEFYLLKEAGYGISLEEEINKHQPILGNQYYYYNPGVGFSFFKETISEISEHPFIFYGQSLLCMAKNDFTDPSTLKDAKRLIRLTLDVLLERHEKLKSRELFVK